MAAKRVGGVVVNTEAIFTSRRSQIIALAAQYRIPVIYSSRLITEDGGLMSYGSAPEPQRDAGRYVARILKGEKPADLPVFVPTKFDLAINLKTAKALGLTIPDSLLAEADEVIK
jgi:putative ABC transport system substrate-binding protein